MILLMGMRKGIQLCKNVTDLNSVLWINWNKSNWNTYLKYIICILYFIGIQMYFVFQLHFTVICIWNTVQPKQVTHTFRGII